jgi:RNA polymerase sigma-70 factor (ECF subfamily)
MTTGEITLLLRRMSSETGSARKQTYDELVALVYEELRRCARQQLRTERADSLQPTVLVHAAYERMLKDRMSYQDRHHFYRMAATAMRRFLIDRARRVAAARRGSRQVIDPITPETPVVASLTDPELLLAIDRAMDVLTPAQVQLTELRYWGGLTLEEAADVMGLNAETARKRWSVIRAVLLAELRDWARRRR